MIVSSGIGSGLDIASLVQQLVEAERQPTASRLSRFEARAQSQLSGLGQFRGALTSLQTAAAGLAGPGSAFEAVTVNSANEERFTATGAAGAAAGLYEVEITQLAQAHRLASAAFTDSDTDVGYGNLTVEVGSESFSLSIDSAAASLSEIRDAINTATDNAGVTASIVTTDDGARLILKSTESGADSALRVTASGGDGGLDALVYDVGVLENLSVLDAAQDAKIKVDGFVATSATNNFAGVIEGVTINAVEAEAGVAYDLSVVRDDGAIRAGIQKFVDRFNNVATTVANLTRVGEDGLGSVLTGDSLLRNASNQLRSYLGGQLGSGALSTLADLGIEFDNQGKLSIDSDALDEVLATNFVGVVAFFGGDNGVVANLDGRIDALIDSDGLIQGREDGLELRLDRIADQRVALDRRIAAVEARYQAQFSALDSLIAQLRSTSDFLSNQLQNLPGSAPRR